VIAVLLVAVGFAAHTLWQRDKRIDAHSDLVSAAIEDSSRVLGLAMAAPIGRNAEWAAARSSRSRIADLLQAAPADQATITRAQAYLAAFDDADSDRRLAEQIEDVVMMSATHEDVESWQHMDQQFRDLFRDRGINLETLPPMEVARRIRENRSADRLSEALELWIGTLGQLGAMGVKELTAETMQPWADAMFAADTDPVRTGIRRLIYDRKRPTPEDVEAVIAGVDLATLSPRTLSWLATTFQMAGDLDRCNEILLIAVDCYPSDFMLNHDVAYSLASQNNWSGVIRFYMRCTAIRPDVDGVWRGLGNAFRKNGELPRSLLALRKAISLAPEHAPTYVDLAMTQLSMCEYADAEASAQKANQLGSKTPQTYLLQGEALLHLNRVAEALVALQICQSLASEESEEALRAADLIIECRQLLGTGPQPDSNSETGTPPSGQTPTSPAQDE